MLVNMDRPDMQGQIDEYMKDCFYKNSETDLYMNNNIQMAGEQMDR